MRERKKYLQKGDVFGCWTVIADTASEGNERRWLCRCICGTERYVLERSLIYGYSNSCGCQRNVCGENESDENFIGRKFGDLTVIGAVDIDDKRFGKRWLCRCACGNTKEFSQSRLITGRQTNCGCQIKKIYRDIAGKKYGRLTALFPLDGRDARGSKYWHCRCECGNELDIPYNTLLYSNTKSCGCKKKEHDLVLNETLSRVDGTCIDHLRSKKIPSNNTTGVRGVSKDRKGKYVARIAFRKKQYWLGSYPTLEEAAAARLEADEILNDKVVAFYEYWKTRADEDAEWAKANPIHIEVMGTEKGIMVTLFPQLEPDRL